MFVLIYAKALHWDPTSDCWYQKRIMLASENKVILLLSSLVSVVLLVGYQQDAAVFPSVADGSKDSSLREVGRVILYFQ